MKTRCDFVSNSSSSSFILSNSPIFEHFKITKEELNNAIIDLLGKDYVNEYKANCKKLHLEYAECANDLDVKYGVESGFGPYWIYDMSIESDRKEALDRFGSLLSEWDCHSFLSTANDTNFTSIKSAIAHYERVCKDIGEIYQLRNCWDGIVRSEKEAKELEIWTKTNEKQPDGCYGFRSPAPDFVGKLLLDIRKRCGVMTNKEVLEQEFSKFFVHFDDNVLWSINGSTVSGKNEEVYENPRSEYEKKHNEEVESSIYESESYTKERVFEILWNYWVKKGLIDPDDEEFLKEYYPMSEYQRIMKEDEPAKYDYVKFDTSNERNLSYHDLVDEILTFEGHEG